MKPIARSLLCMGLAAIFALSWAPDVFAQGATSGAITGVVTDPDGAALPGATVTAIHQPTGTRYTAYTRVDGRYSIFNVRVGGPYSLTIELQGFASLTRADLQVTLGQELAVTFAMQLQAVQEVITVTATSDPIINPTPP